MGYERFVVVGDSCAEGLDDPYPDGSRYRGWADLVAARLAADNPGLRYANLAVRGRRLDQIVTEQFAVAAEFRPDLVALFGGGNDVLTSGFDPGVVAGRVAEAVARLTAVAPTVLVFTLSDLSQRMRVTRSLQPRVTALNTAIRQAAAKHGATVIDLADDPSVRDLRYFGPDRLHLSEHGHQRLAGHLLRTLDVPFDGRWLEPLPGEPAAPGLAGHARWLWREVRPVAVSRMRNRLVGRSPGDGFHPKRPELQPLAAAELEPWPTPAPAAAAP